MFCSRLYCRDSLSNTKGFDTVNQYLNFFFRSIPEVKRSRNNSRGLSPPSIQGFAVCSMLSVLWESLLVTTGKRKFPHLVSLVARTCVFLDHPLYPPQCDCVCVCLPEKLPDDRTGCLWFYTKFSRTGFLNYGWSVYICRICAIFSSHQIKQMPDDHNTFICYF